MLSKPVPRLRSIVLAAILFAIASASTGRLDARSGA
jgi:hypothetical protein